MRCPFPGMDPYLEHPALWPDVHNSLIAAIRDEIAPALAPRYYTRLERRTYLLRPDDLEFIGRPDVAVITREPARPLGPVARAGVAVLEVEVPLLDEVSESYLEVREVGTGTLVTILELLSPVNKLHGQGRRDYIHRRNQVFWTLTNLVEVDLLRAGDPMPVSEPTAPSDYRVLISRGSERPRAQLYPVSIRQPLPTIPLPLLPGDVEPPLALNAVLHALYDRARFDLGLDYRPDPVPPPSVDAAAWARDLIDWARLANDAEQ
jgi:hypothetical protein